MDTNHNYSRSEISKILSKASEIQKQKDLYSDKDGLSEQELIAVAKEVGIDHSSLLEAMQTFDEPGLNEKFSWLTGNSSIQTTDYIVGEINEENWKKVVQEIRKETGGIGALKNDGNTFEWEQRKKDIGYKHVSLSYENGKTHIQLVNSWKGVKFISTFFAVMIGFMLTAVSLDGSSWSDIALIIAPIGGLLGLIPSRLFLNHYFNKQKKETKNILSRIRRVLSKPNSPEISIEEKEAYRDENVTQNSGTSIRNNG